MNPIIEAITTGRRGDRSDGCGAAISTGGLTVYGSPVRVLPAAAGGLLLYGGVGAGVQIAVVAVVAALVAGLVALRVASRRDRP